jgi:hypothetical protein
VGLVAEQAGVGTTDAVDSPQASVDINSRINARKLFIFMLFILPK